MKLLWVVAESDAPWYLVWVCSLLETKHERVNQAVSMKDNPVLLEKFRVLLEFRRSGGMITSVSFRFESKESVSWRK